MPSLGQEVLGSLPKPTYFVLMGGRAKYRDGCKQCGACHSFKPPEMFRRDKTRWDGRVGRCYECERAIARQRRREDPEKFREIDRRYAVKFRYGLSLEDYDAALANGCAVCGVGPDESRMVMDHDHESGSVRSVLCTNCNLGLGLFQDEPDRLRAAADYLEHHLPINT